MISIEEANKILGLRLGNRSADSVNTWYVGVSTTSISEDGSGISEPSDSNGYKRVAIQNNSSNFTAPANMTVKNTNPIVFDEVTADCGTVTDIFLSPFLIQTTENLRTGGKNAICIFETHLKQQRIRIQYRNIEFLFHIILIYRFCGR